MTTPVPVSASAEAVLRAYLHRKAAVVEFWKENYPVSAPDVAAHFGISKRTVYRHLHDAGCDLSEIVCQVDMDRVKEAKRLRDQGKKVKDIAETFGVTRRTITNYLQKAREGKR